MLGKKMSVMSVVILGLTACGGGGGGSSEQATVDPPPVLSAQEKAQFEASQYYRGKYDNPAIFDALVKARTLTANGQIIESLQKENGQWIISHDYRSLPQGFATLTGEEVVNEYRDAIVIRSYRGFRSGLWVSYAQQASRTGAHRAVDSAAYMTKTPENHFPTAGKATYTGMAFDIDGQGSLTYHVNFSDKKGNGSIVGLPRYGTIVLHEAAIIPTLQPDGVTHRIHAGQASSAVQGALRDYRVNFAGDQAEELVGTVKINNNEMVGFHGTRGAISE